MMLIEIIKEYKSCWKVGTIREVKNDFAQVLISQGYAKALDMPRKNKMMSEPRGKKCH